MSVAVAGMALVIAATKVGIATREMASEERERGFDGGRGGPAWTGMDGYGRVWTGMDGYGRVWTGMALDSLARRE